MVLSLATQNAISLALAAGPGTNNQNYLAAYNAISSDIRASGGFNTGTLNWFAQAGLVNTNAFNPTAQGTYIWAYTIGAAQVQGAMLTQADMQAASDRIAATVFNQLRTGNFIFSDNIGDPINFAPRTIINVDAGAGLAELSA